jgi:hypothetical protein
MTKIGRHLAVALALTLTLSPFFGDIGTAMTASAYVEMVHGGKPGYPPCAWAKPGRACYDRHGLSTASGGDRRR